MKYAIWRADLPAGAATFDSRAAALDAVRAAIEAHGAGFVADWSVLRIPPHGDWQTVAEGAELVERAMGRERPLVPQSAYRRSARRSNTGPRL